MEWEINALACLPIGLASEPVVWPNEQVDKGNAHEKGMYMNGALYFCGVVDFLAIFGHVKCQKTTQLTYKTIYEKENRPKLF